MSIKLIVGLRNPGDAYQRTRHNAGAWYLDALIAQENVQLKLDKKMQSQWGEFKFQDHACKVLLPLTYMNHSGIPVRAMCQFYRIEMNELLVVHDDLDLKVGHIRLKTGGGHGGHNGLKDLIAQMGGAQFHRLRIGIGHPGHKDLVHDYVLGKPSLADKQRIDHAITRGLSVLPILFSRDVPNAMNVLNEVDDGI